MFIKPLADRVLIAPIEIEQKSAGGIVLSGAEKQIAYLHGTVISCGPGKQKATGEYVPIPVAVGDVIIYGNVSSTVEDMVDGKKVFLVEQNAIVGIVHETFAHLSKDIQEQQVKDDGGLDDYQFVPLVPSTPSTNYIGTEDE